MIRDLTQGKVSGVMWRYALPMLGSVVFQQLYNMADTVIAGKCIDENALAAVDASFPITMLFMAVALGCNLGCSVIVSRLFGARRYREVRESVSTILIAVGLLGVVLTGIGLASATSLMRLVQTPGDIFADAMRYLYIYIGGFLFVLLYNVCNGIFSALGDSRTPFYYLIASSLGNIGLDLLFVLVFRMGVAGLAWATFLTQSVAAALCAVALLIRMRKLRDGSERAKAFSLRLLGQMCTVAIPSVLQQSFISVGNLVIQGLVNGYGSSVVAGYTAAVKLNTFVLTTVTAMAGAVSGFAAQNMGAHQLTRVKRGLNVGLGMAAMICVPMSLIYAFCRKGALGLLMDQVSDAAIATGSRFLLIVSPFYLVIGCKLMYDAVLRGAESMTAFMIATFADLAVRVALCFVLNRVLGVDGIWWSWPIGWSVATVLSAIFYYGGGWYKSARARARFAQAGYDDRA